MVVRRYGRVSKREQAKNSNAFERQLWSLEYHLQELGVPLEESPLYQDQQSGRIDERPGLEQMLSDLQRGDTILIARIDRIARDAEFNARLAKRFKRDRITIIEIYRGTPLDWNNPSDWEYFVRCGIDAELESRKLSRRIRDGYEYRRRGRKPCPKPPWGYLNVNESYCLNPELKRFVLRRIKILKTAANYNEAVRRIKSSPNLYGGSVSLAGLHRWFHNVVLRGHTGYGEVYADRHAKKLEGYELDDQPAVRAVDGRVLLHQRIEWDTHPDQAVMSEQEYNQICKSIARKVKNAKPMSKVRLTPASGLLRCGACGGSMVLCSSTKHSRRYYTCTSAKQRLTPDSCTEKGCVRLEVVEAAIWESIRQAAKSVADFAVEAARDEIENVIDPERERLERTLAQLNAMPHNPALESAKYSIRQQIQGLARHRQEQVRDNREERELLKVIASELESEDFQDEISQEETRAIFQALVDVVRVVKKSAARQPGQWSIQVSLRV